jgi:hypothetical protein
VGCVDVDVDVVFLEARVNAAVRAEMVDEDEGRSLPLKGTKGEACGMTFPVPKSLTKFVTSRSGAKLSREVRIRSQD